MMLFALPLFLSVRSNAANLLVNGTFTGSLAGWIAEGVVFNTGDAGVFSDSAAFSASLFQTVSLPPGLRTWEVSFDFLNGLASPIPNGFQPDSLFISLFMGAGPFGSTLVGGLFDDGFGVFDLTSAGRAAVIPGGTFVPSPKGSGWTRFHGVVSGTPSTEFLTVAFAFYNLNGITGDSVAAVDNIEISPVPEPGAACLTALAALAFFRRRTRTFCLSA